MEEKDLEKIEEDLKKKEKNRKEQKISGRSVFKLQEIIKEKAEKENPKEDINKDSTS